MSEDCKKDSCDKCQTKTPNEIFERINEKAVFSQTLWAQSYLISATLDVACNLCKMNKKLDILLDEVCLMSKSLSHIDRRLCGEERPREERCRD
jgi:hypothetical protein